LRRVTLDRREIARRPPVATHRVVLIPPAGATRCDVISGDADGNGEMVVAAAAAARDLRQSRDP